MLGRDDERGAKDDALRREDDTNVNKARKKESAAGSANLTTSILGVVDKVFSLKKTKGAK
jgi:hypothetical protein